MCNPQPDNHLITHEQNKRIHRFVIYLERLNRDNVDFIDHTQLVVIS